jgi:hypothetical protein
MRSIFCLDLCASFNKEKVQFCYQVFLKIIQEMSSKRLAVNVRSAFSHLYLNFVLFSQGDGSSEPEAITSDAPVMIPQKSCNLFQVHFEVDLMQWLLFAVAFATRIFFLDEPNSVV